MKFVHPVTPIIETKKYPYARSYRTGFIDKVMDAFYVLSGGIPGHNGIPGKTDDHVFGIFDYLTLGVHFFISEKLMRLAQKPSSTLSLVISVALFALFNIPRYLFATVMTVFCLPIIGIVNLVTSAKGDKIKHHILNYFIKEDPSSQNFDSTGNTLKVLLKEKYHTTLEDSQWSNPALIASDTPHITISLINKYQNQPEQTLSLFFDNDNDHKLLQSLQELNINNLAVRIEDDTTINTIFSKTS